MGFTVSIEFNDSSRCLVIDLSYVDIKYIRLSF